MSRPVSSPSTVTINRDQAIDQDALNKIKTFKKSLGPNDRVLVQNSGTTTVYTQHKESVSETFIRKLDNLEKNAKAAWSHVRDSFSGKNQGNGSEATKNVKDTPTQKSPISISVKQFNLLITPFNNTCIIPVLDNLAHQRDNLKDLGRLSCEMNLENALKFFSTDPQSLAKVEKEFSAFLQFAQAQGRGESVTHQNRDAIDFAKRWAAVPTSEYKELKARFGETYLAIFDAAFALSTFDLTNRFDKS